MLFSAEGGRAPFARTTTGGVGCTIGDAVGSRQARVGCRLLRFTCLARGSLDEESQATGDPPLVLVVGCWHIV